tara:strand:+ start:5065 stop:5307 length:243 start_codon:yes stop_codon:yes gene_type:complete
MWYNRNIIKLGVNMSKKKSNIIDFKKATAKKFNDENEIVFTVEDKDYQLGDMVHQAHNDNGIEFIFKLEEFDDDSDETIH